MVSLSAIRQKVMARMGRLPTAARHRLVALPLVALAIVVLGVAGATAGGGYFMYRTYNYVQHDNDFCLTCHLMKEPWERFAQSAHRGLGCKACHQPNPVQRAKMGLRQILVQPKGIDAHAEVPDERCLQCHVQGDPKDWIQVGRSRGHLVHLESMDPVLRDLSCLACHDEGVHDFRATNRSCAVGGCHDKVKVRLGGMAHLDTECIVCHDFKKPIPLAEGASTRGRNERLPVPPASLRPGADQCLTCHAMRDRGLGIDVATEPHKAVCGLCHNAHDQVRAADAVKSCTNADCHSRPEDIDNDHHKWKTVDLENCVQCHKVHTFRVDGDACLDCHDEVMTPSRPAATRSPVGAPSDTGVSHPDAPSLDEPDGAGPGAPLFAPNWGPSPGGPTPGDEDPTPLPYLHELTPTAPGPIQAPDTVFSHDRHRSVGCRSCHTTEASVVTDDPAWCASCHHSSRSRRSCSACHPPSQLPPRPREVEFHLPGGATVRTLEFPHGKHSDVDCTKCHGSPPAAVAEDFTCVSCHDEHHRAKRVECLACHRSPPSWAHAKEVVHKTCSGALCHKAFDPAPPAPAAQWTRSVCLACHPAFSEADTFPKRPGGP